MAIGSETGARELPADEAFVPERRRGFGRRRSDQQSALALRGLLHDLGHDLATLAYLVEGVRGDTRLAPATRRRVDLIEQQTARLLDLVRDGMWNGTKPAVVAVPALLNQLVRLAAERSAATVTLQATEPISLEVDGTLLWRMVANLVDNAVRAAGPGGAVRVIARSTPDGAVRIEVVDDGPGFGASQVGGAALGLDVVAGLATLCGGVLDVDRDRPSGACARLVFPPVGDREPEGARR